MAIQRKETWYQSRFSKLIAECNPERVVTPLIHGSRFYREVKLQYDMAEGSGGLEMPNASVDFIELDAAGRLHLWEAKLLHSYELISGRVIGQLMFYDWLFRTYERELLRPHLVDSGLNPDEIEGFNNPEEDIRFCSWNILVCGGEGYEIAAGINPVMWNHHLIPEDYFTKTAPKVSTFHLYHDQSDDEDGLIVQDIWHISIFNPMQMEQNALLAYLQSDENWLYNWEINEGKLTLEPRPDFPKDALRLTDGMPEKLYWEFTGRKHLLVSDESS
ncbi:hypothetical protein [Pseudanabaena sp. ABRG5-3]|uniref:hypothetical protein n=1 Tax=Pseudanabaena sp. ABRG5-3 TaxID=685565 RepID=UPI000DC6FE38|nr:hypothetical protein [Pseudanabaena sp. ABRG5-3]BBC23588.1 hypothetical protein ABRG53_1331 [Pseudanabaena sp. ABRG5-3]